MTTPKKTSIYIKTDKGAAALKFLKDLPGGFKISRAFEDHVIKLAESRGFDWKGK